MPDNSIHLHKQLAEILENFTNDLKADLDELNQKIGHNEREIDSYYEKMSSHVENFTSKMQISLESVSANVEVSLASLKQGQLLIKPQQRVKSSMKLVTDTTGDAVHRMERFISTFLQGHAQMADEQEKALQVTTNKVQSRMMDLADLVGEAHEGTMELKATLQLLVPVVIDLCSRQAALEDVSPSFYIVACY